MTIALFVMVGLCIGNSFLLGYLQWSMLRKNRALSKAFMDTYLISRDVDNDTWKSGINKNKTKDSQ